LWNYYFGNEFV